MEPTDSVLKRFTTARVAITRWTIEPRFAGAKVRAATAAVAAGSDIEEPRRVGVRERSVDRARIAGQRIHTGNDRCGHAGPAEDEPAARVQAVSVVHGYAGVGIGDRRNVCNCPTPTTRVRLPRRLGDVSAAAAAGAAPYSLAEAARGGVSSQRRTANRRHV